jgi:hypothetical protein
MTQARSDQATTDSNANFPKDIFALNSLNQDGDAASNCSIESHQATFASESLESRVALAAGHSIPPRSNVVVAGDKGRQR